MSWTDLRPRGAYLYAAQESPLRRALLAPLALLELPYGAAARLHRGLYERGWWGRARLPAQVVCVGNLCVGGSAKTPTAGWLANELARRGRRVALLSRGLRARSSAAVRVVSDGTRVQLGAAEAGDEPVWLAEHTRGVPVLSGADRAALGRRAIAEFQSEILILDDGFQHHRLARDVDLVCVDAALGLGNGHVLPRGPLREPVQALGRADALIFTRAEPGQGLPGLPAAPEVPRFALQVAPARLRGLGSGELQPLESLRGAAVGVLAALARPGGLRATLVRAGAVIAAEQLYPDHHLYAQAEIARLPRGVRWITTGKDAVKLPADWLAGHRIEVLEEEVRPWDGQDLAGWLLSRLDLPTAGAGASRVESPRDRCG